MKIGRVTGTVISTSKVESLEGIKLLLVQPLDDTMQNSGHPIVACDTVQAGEGDLVIYEGGREAALALDNWFNPSDASVIGIIDQLDQAGK
ncbi:MAG: EutN/CcmL family microcompartment protein [Candidatus Brocadiales bacterium]|nr:EutN/CcmL family microcompartment protein [Candidatus Brocadiales bacterium]